MKNNRKNINAASIIAIAYAIIDLLISYGLWADICVYFLNHAYHSKGYFPTKAVTHSFTRTSGALTAEVFVTSNILPDQRVQFHGDILTIAYDSLSKENFIFSPIEEKLNDILKPYGLYFEIGEQWNLSVYSIE